MDGRVAITTLSLYLIAVYCSVILGCSCPPLSGVPLSRSESLCQDYNRSSNVLVARVINASCNCAPSGNDDAFFQDITNVSCVSATLSTGGHVVTRVIVQATCNIAEDAYGVSSCASITNSFEPSECPYEGQEMMDCVPLCQNTCSNVNVDSPCPEVCIRGCGCPGSMVLDENRGRCVRQSQCPNANAACPIVGQVTTSCASACPPDCLRLSSGIIEPCPAVCARCDCAGDDEVVDYITGKCVRQEQCTATITAEVPRCKMVSLVM
ncbi:keratin-associated protein 10-6-like isoform X2 [Dysidea avara]|uniref:keratin-associated protein 10-6-like isoform X2 n=1 Tax=Dysidea avara TaxID=196820 RepID=UPI003325709D